MLWIDTAHHTVEVRNVSIIMTFWVPWFISTLRSTRRSYKVWWPLIGKDLLWHSVALLGGLSTAEFAPIATSKLISRVGIETWFQISPISKDTIPLVSFGFFFFYFSSSNHFWDKLCRLHKGKVRAVHCHNRGAQKCGFASCSPPPPSSRLS